MQAKIILVALFVASAFVGASSVSVLGSQSSPIAEDSEDTAPVLQDGKVEGNNVTIRSVNLTNVTLENVYVNRLVANVTHDGTDEQVEVQNVTAAAVEVGDATVRNLTFDSVRMNEQFATDLLGRVGTGTDPADTIPSDEMEAHNLSDRTITGIQFGTLEVSNAALQNVTLEGESNDTGRQVSNATLAGQNITAEIASAQNVTIAGWSADETNGDGNETES